MHSCTIFCASVNHTPNFYRVESITGLDFHTAFCRSAALTSRLWVMLERLSISNLTYDIDDFGCGQSKINASNIKRRFFLRDGLNREERFIFSFNGIGGRLWLETNRTSSINFFLFLFSPNVHFWPMSRTDPDHDQVSWPRAMWLREIPVKVLAMQKSDKNESLIFQNY